MNAYHRPMFVAVPVLLITLLAAPVRAAEPEPVTCLPLKQIVSTKIVDDQNIVFRTHGKRFYNNHLPHKCNGLKSAGKYRYKTSLSELCNVDIITVLHDAGGSFMDGASCGLGTFTPIEDPALAKKPDAPEELTKKKP